MLSRIFLLAFIAFTVGRTTRAIPAPPLPPALSSLQMFVCDTRNTTTGDCCVFPFTYRNETFYDCTTKNLGVEWCATTADYDSNRNKWGKCAGQAPNPIYDTILESNDDKTAKKARFNDHVDLFEGDIVVDNDIRRRFLNTGINGSTSRTKRATIRGRRSLWLDRSGKPLIPYRIQSSNAHARGVIQRAMTHLRSKVHCLRFVPYRSGMGAYLSFHNGGGCWSSVGRTKSAGPQLISIGNGCQHLGVVAHEIGHALGFWHEQSRPDRDRYVTINWQNIMPGMGHNFKKQSHSSIDSRGVSYDYKSIMHYSAGAFARRRGLYTIKKRNGGTDLGQRYGLTAKDALQANKMYCGGVGPKPPTRPPVPPPPPGCRYQDNHRWCPYWKSKGYCTHATHSKFMKKSCQKSCYCKESCSDKKPSSCSGWVSRGYCSHSKYGTYVKTYCRKSCRLC